MNQETFKNKEQMVDEAISYQGSNEEKEVLMDSDQCNYLLGNITSFSFSTDNTEPVEDFSDETVKNMRKLNKSHLEGKETDSFDFKKCEFEQRDEIKHQKDENLNNS